MALSQKNPTALAEPRGDLPRVPRLVARKTKADRQTDQDMAKAITGTALVSGDGWRVGVATGLRIAAGMFLLPAIYLIGKLALSLLWGGPALASATLSQYVHPEATTAPWDVLAVLVCVLAGGSVALMWIAARISPQDSLAKLGK
jgi:hypothetical protein